MRSTVSGIGLALMTAAGAATPALAATATRAPFGTLADGTAVEAVTLTNGHGVSARIMTLGATLQSLTTPDRLGRADEITLGYDTAAEYLATPQYFGASIGRYANRIRAGRFVLDGKTYKLPINNEPNSLHGGPNGFDKRVWTITAVRQGAGRTGDASVTLSYLSRDGEQGYPGALTATVTYTLTEANELRLDYRATTDRPTVVNLTNHTFFNLSGARALRPVLDERMRLVASRYTPVDATLIPTGELRPVAGTPFDFRTGRPIGEGIRDGRDDQIMAGRGFDHNYVVDGPAGTMRLAARIEDATSGRVMEVRQTAPGVQFYTGNFLDGKAKGRAGAAYRQGDGFCLEPQLFPDTPNQPAFGSARLDPGQTYVNSFSFRFSTLRR